MYKELRRKCTAIALLIKPFVWWSSRWHRCRGLLKLPINECQGGGGLPYEYVADTRRKL